MKNSLTDITKGLKTVQYGEQLSPSRDWLVLLSVALLLTLASIAWNLLAFKKVTDGEAVGTGTAPQVGSNVSLEPVAQLFEARALEEGRYRSEYRFVDPSAGAR